MGEGSRKRKIEKQHKKRKRPPSPVPERKLVRKLTIHGRFWIVAALALIYALGFYVRFEDFPEWRKNSEIFFFDDNPVLVNGDGYYYIRLARDLADGHYNAVDAQRWYPDSPPRPSPPPLLSVLTWVLHKILGVSLDWVAILLPVLLAPLLLLPIYGLARIAGGGRIMGLAAALIAVVSEYYVGRTRVGWLDSDCLILTLTVTICYLCIRFARETTASRYVYGAAIVVGYGVFLWWWDTAPEVVSAICLTMFAIALVFFYRPARREGVIFGVSMAGVVFLALLWRGFDAPVSLVRSLMGRLAFVAGGEAGPFPSIVGNIRELEVLGFSQMAKLTSGHSVLFILAVAGFLWWLVTRRMQALLFIVLTLLALLPIRFGNRFLIFQVPIVALGLGFLVDRLWEHRKAWRPASIAALLLILVPFVLCFHYVTTEVYRSHIDRSLGTIKAVIDETPKEATLWTTWWHGYPALYYTRRAVITDGGSLQGQRLVYQNLPLACSDARLAANFMQFWVGNGTVGMERLYDAMNQNHAAALTLLKNVCAAGPNAARIMIGKALTAGRLRKSADLSSVEDWLSFFFPKQVPPTYLLLTQDLTESMEWFRRGTWDPARRRGMDVFYRPYYGVQLADGNLRGRKGLYVDQEKGTIYENQVDGSSRSHPLTHTLTFTGEKIEVTDFDNEDGLRFEWIRPIGFGAAMSPAVAESVFNNLFIRHRSYPRYFRPVSLNTPYFQIWEVRGESVQ